MAAVGGYNATSLGFAVGTLATAEGRGFGREG